MEERAEAVWVIVSEVVVAKADEPGVVRKLLINLRNLCQTRSSTSHEKEMGGSQNYGPFSDPYYNTAAKI